MQISNGLYCSEKSLSDRILALNQLLENPAISEASSNLAIAGRYVLTPEIFIMLEQNPPVDANSIIAAMSLIFRRPTVEFAAKRLDTLISFGRNRQEG